VGSLDAERAAKRRAKSAKLFCTSDFSRWFGTSLVVLNVVNHFSAIFSFHTHYKIWLDVASKCDHTAEIIPVIIREFPVNEMMNLCPYATFPIPPE